MRSLLNALRILSSGASRFECAVLRRSLPNERGEFHLARDQIRCFQFSFEHQCSRVAPDVAEEEFNRAGKRDSVSFAPAPLRFRRLCGPPNLRSGIEQLENAFSRALSLKPQRAVVLTRKSDLDVPSANEVWRLCLGHDGAACVHD